MLPQHLNCRGRERREGHPQAGQLLGSREQDHYSNSDQPLSFSLGSFPSLLEQGLVSFQAELSCRPPVCCLKRLPQTFKEIMLLPWGQGGYEKVGREVGAGGSLRLGTLGVEPRAGTISQPGEMVSWSSGEAEPQGQGPSLARGSQAPIQALEPQSPPPCRNTKGVPGATDRAARQ